MKDKTKYFIIAAFLGVVFTLFSLYATNLAFFKNMEYKLLDWRFHIRGPVPEEQMQENPIIIVSIDDQSYDGIGEVWPWSREKYAHLISNLNKAGAKVIGIDVVMDIPRYDKPEGDDALADTLKKYHNVVLIGKVEGNKKSTALFSTVRPLKKFLDTGVSWGLGSLAVDADGIYRRYYPYQFDMPSFSLSIASKYWDIDPDEFIDMDKELNSDFLTIPYYEMKDILIDYAGPAYSFRYFSFADVIDDSTYDLKEDYDLDYFEDLLEEGVFKDKIVLVGATIEELHDLFPTPYLTRERKNSNTGKVERDEIEMPGVEIHANALRNFLNKKFFSQFNGNLQMWILILISLTIFLVTWLGRVWYGLLTYAVFTLAYIYASIWAFTNQMVVLEMLPAILAFSMVFGSTTLTGYILSLKEKRQIRGAFAHYVPADVVNELINNPDKLTLGGEERYMTVIFSDVESFTSVSEKLTPHELVELLNEYLTAMTDIILEHRGIIDKYEGDAIMAEFGAPVYYPNHAQMACKAALRMQEKLKEMRKVWKEQGRSELKARVGINSGNMVVGNMGSRDVFDYTVMGDSVNLGSRLEGANKQYGTYIMLSEYTYEWIKDDFYARPLDLLRVKGKEKPVEVYELMAEKDGPIPDYLPDLIATFDLGYLAYKDKNWEGALKHFRKCGEILPGDPPSEIYVKRCEEYLKNPPPENWDGVFVMTTK